MAGPFDAYRKWLGIPPEEQPPNHYRLLAIAPFEDDPDVIAHAADQRMAHVKTFASGRHAALSQTILNELAAARVCLLNPQAKALYDSQLRARLGAQARGAVGRHGSGAGESSRGGLSSPGSSAAYPRSEPAVAEAIPVRGAALPVAAAVSDAEGPQQPVAVSAGPSRSFSVRRRQKSSFAPLAILGGVAIAALVAIVALSGDPHSPDGQPAHQTTSVPQPAPSPSSHPSSAGTTSQPPKPQPPSPPIMAPPLAPAEGTADPGESTEPPVETSPATPAETTVGSQTGTNPEAMAAKPDLATTLPGEGVGPAAPAPFESLVTQPETDPGIATMPDVSPVPGAAPPWESASERLPVPEPAARQAAEKGVRTTLAASFAAAADADKKVDLANELIVLARETHDDPAAQFVAFSIAAELLGEAGQVERAMTVADELGERFDLDAIVLRGQLLRKANEALGRGGTADAVMGIFAAAESSADQALAIDHFDAAEEFFRIAGAAARRLNDRRLISDAQTRLAEVPRLRGELPNVLAAEQTLQATPDDPEANLLVGAWRCFVRGDWAAGLPLLVKGSDAALADLARQNLAQPVGDEQQVAVADGWWSQSESRKGIEAGRIRDRALEGYRDALPGLSGLTRVRVEKRLQEAGISTGIFALRFDGTTSCVIVRNYTYNGTSPITIETICKPTSGPQGLGDFGGFGGTGGRTMMERLLNMQVVVGNTGRGGFLLGRLGDGWAVAFSHRSAPPPLPLSTARNRWGAAQARWVHLAGVYDGQALRLFAEGRLVETTPVAGPHVASNAPLFVGARPPDGTSGNQPSGFFQGYIRGVRISHVARYTEDFTPPQQLTRDNRTALLLWFDQGQGEQIMDATRRVALADIKGAEWVRLEPQDLINPPADPEPPRPDFPGRQPRGPGRAPRR
jgi:hypothetical protein